MNSEANPTINSLAILAGVSTKHWQRILLTTISVTVVAVIVSLLWPKTYRATAVLMITESKTASSNVVNSFFNPKLYGTYRGIISNQMIAKRAIQEFELGPSVNESDFLMNLSVDILRDTRLIEVSYRSGDAAEAAKVANFVADEASRYNRSLYKAEIESQQATLATETKRVVEEYERSKKALREFREIAQIEAIKARIDNLLKSRGDQQAKLLELKVASSRAQKDDVSSQYFSLRKTIDDLERKYEFDRTNSQFWTYVDLNDQKLKKYQSILDLISNKGAAIQSLDSQLQVLKPTISTSRRLSRAAGSPDSAAASATWLGSLPDLEFREEILNPAYDDLVTRRSEFESVLKGASEEKKRLETSVEEVSNSLKGIQTTLIEYEAEKKQLDLRFKLLTLQYEKVHEMTAEGLRAYISTLDESLSGITKELEERQRELGTRSTQLEALELEFEVAKTNFKLFNEQREKVLLDIAEKFQDVTMIDSAIAPAYPVWPRKTYIVVAVFCMSLLVSFVAYYMREVMSGPSPRRGLSNQ